jgi:phosphoribosyl 1,2-cyclic phosphodiesterase
VNIRFWGVRGSIPVSGTRYLRAGGNTTCLEIQSQGHRLILDGGTGLRALGEHLGFQPVDALLLFTHVHWDHIQGVPFFGPAFHPGSSLTLAGASRDSGRLRDALDAQMRPPQFPITLDALQARLAWRDVGSGETFEHGPFRITALELSHPDGVLAWRIEAEGRSVVFATDVEHAGLIDPALVALSEGADLLVHDAQYTGAEYRGEAGPSRAGWGHSTLEEACEVARRAGVGELALFHHDPQRDDDALALLEARARDLFPSSFAAREGAPRAL